MASNSTTHLTVTTHKWQPCKGQVPHDTNTVVAPASLQRGKRTLEQQQVSFSVGAPKPVPFLSGL